MTRLPRLLLISLSILFANDAFSFDISPTRIQINPESGVGVVRLNNTRDTKSTFSVQVFSWDESSSPKPSELTDDLFVMPPVFDVLPQENQHIRVALRGPRQIKNEQTYRLIINQVTNEVEQHQGVNLNYRINLPIYVVESGARADPQWRIEKSVDGAKSLRLAVYNSGNAHLRLDRIKLSSSGGAEPILDERAAGSVFAGEGRAWQLALDPKRTDEPLLSSR